MKLLLDANLSPDLPSRLKDQFPDIAHVRDIGLGGATDHTIWKFALDNDYIIVSKDSDFYDFIGISGYPPKFIWIRKGNCSTNEIENLLRNYFGEIFRFAEDEKNGCLIFR